MNSFSLGMDLLPPAVIPILMKRDVQSKLDVKDLLSEPDLRELNKSLATLIPKTNASLEGQAFQYLEHTFRKALQTARSAKLSLTHGGAVWSFLTGFLELGSLSTDLSLRDVCLSSSTWVEIFELYLSRSQNAKPKPAKQVLLTLTKLLSKISDKAVREHLKDYVIGSTVTIVCEHGESSSVKPAFQVLEHFLRKEVFNSSDIISEMARMSLALGNFNSSKDYSAALRSSFLSSLSPLQYLSFVKSFASSILRRVRFPDITPVASRLLLFFFKPGQHPLVLRNEDKSLYFKPPVWLVPIREAIKEEPALLEICETYLLPGLLRLSSADAMAFLDTLPYDDLKEGKAGSHPASDIQLCLMTLKICVDPSLSEASDSAFVDPRRYSRYDLMYIARGLLAHPSPTIRITAFSLLSTKFPESLDALQQALPSLQAEVDPKTRNEFITIMQRFCNSLEHNHIAMTKNHLPDKPVPKTDFVHKREIEQITENDFDLTSGRLLRRPVAFSKWYIRFLVEELQPTASYQRHFTALKILDYLLQVGVNCGGSRILFAPAKIVDNRFNHGHEQFFGSRFLRVLIDLTMNPFDDVRLTASSILKHVLWNVYQWDNNPNAPRFMDPNMSESPQLPCRTSNRYVYHTLRKAEDMMNRTGRADHADGVGRLYSLVYNSSKELSMPHLWFENEWSILDHVLTALENDIKIAEDDLRSAVKTAPLHGKLVALRHIINSNGFPHLLDLDWSAQTAVDDRILCCCMRIWEAVKGVLCFDSPEGYELGEDEIDQSGVGTKDTLSFCWRALKESSSLMNVWVTSTGYNVSCPNHGIRYKYFKKLGDLAFTQLAELRHRGAFSTVSQTFYACCKKCTDPQSGSVLIRQLPKDWYRRALIIIEENASALTRRSAGIPAIITGILKAFPTGTFFDHVMLDLQAMADIPIEALVDLQNPRLPQVHALNCLKDVFTDACLGPASEAYISETLEIAAGCLESKLWAIRNCGLMLFRALLSRLNAGTDVASTRASSSHRRFSKLIYEKYSNLPSLILKLLRQGDLVSMNIRQNDEAFTDASSLHAQKVFPALEIIERSGMPTQHSMDIDAAIRHHMKSPVWAIREKAAKVLAYLIDDKNVLNQIKVFIKAKDSSQNALHGRLLCVRSLICRVGVNQTDELRVVLLLILDAFDTFVTLNVCPLTVAAYLDIVGDGFEILFKQDTNSVGKEFVTNLEARLPALSQKLSVPPLNSPTGRSSLSLLTQAVDRFLHYISQASIFSNKNSRNKTGSTSANLELNVDSYSVQALNSDDEVGGMLEAQIRQMQDIVDENEYKSSPLQRGPHMIDSANTAFPTISPKNRPSEAKISSLDPALDLDGLKRHLEEDQLISQLNPQHDDDRLRLVGANVGEAYIKNRGDFKVRCAMAAWICRLSLAGDEHSDLTTRLAAVESIAGFTAKLRNQSLSNWAAPELLGVYLALYDILSDDDEDVRDQGAIVASTILSETAFESESHKPGSITLIPSAASNRLLEYLTSKYNDSSILWIHTARCVTGATLIFKLGPPEAKLQPTEINTDGKVTVSYLQLRPVFDLIKEAMQLDTALFAEEKQNLFLDPVREAKAWAEVMLRLRPRWINPDIIIELDTWCTEGLTALVAISASQEDGPLGWTSKPEVFTLGVRIIFVTKVLVYGRVFEREKSDDRRNLNLLALLRRLLEVGEKNLLHGLWLQHIEETLDRECHTREGVSDC